MCSFCSSETYANFNLTEAMGLRVTSIVKLGEASKQNSEGKHRNAQIDNGLSMQNGNRHKFMVKCTALVKYTIIIFAPIDGHRHTNTRAHIHARLLLLLFKDIVCSYNALLLCIFGCFCPVFSTCISYSKMGSAYSRYFHPG